MGIRDKEIKRIAEFCKSRGIRVQWKPYRSGDPSASWDAENNILTMFTWPKKSKTETVLDFVHELAHYASWVVAGKKTPKRISEAIAADSEGKATKKHNRDLYYMEVRDARCQLWVVDTLKLNIPTYKILAHKYLALWIYRHVWKIGSVPSEREILRQRKHLYKMWKAA